MSDDEEDRMEDPDYKRWAKSVKVAANFQCQLCGRRGVYLESHHLWSWQTYVDKRYDLQNGIAICRTEHQQFHNIFGWGDVTPWQFEQFKKTYKTMFKLLVDKEKSEGLSEFDIDLEE